MRGPHSPFVFTGILFPGSSRNQASNLFLYVPHPTLARAFSSGRYTSLGLVLNDARKLWLRKEGLLTDLDVEGLLKDCLWPPTVVTANEGDVHPQLPAAAGNE